MKHMGIEIWWKYGARYLQVRNMARVWRAVGKRPAWVCRTNGGRAEDAVCFERHLVIGYLVITYINFDVQKVKRKAEAYPCENCAHCARASWEFPCDECERPKVGTPTMYVRKEG